MTRFIRNSLYTSTSFVRIGIVAIAIVGYIIAAPQSASATTFTVNSTADAADAIPGDGICDDGSGNCTLRAAVMESNFIGGANVITVPSGTYTLTIGPFDDEFNAAGATMESGDLDIVDLSAFSLPQLTSVTINGAGAAATIINGGDIDRVFDINNFAASGAHVDVTFQNLTITNGTAPTSPDGYNEPGGGIQFDGFDNQTFVPAGTLTINNCNITNHSAAGQGGGILAIFGSLIVTGSEVSGNTSVNAAGGGINYDGSAAAGLRTLQITTSRISGNHANNGIFGSGGGVFEGGNANKTIDHSVITNNTAGTQGGGVFNNGGALALNFNVIVSNSASGNPASSGLGNNTGAVNADNNWWGCNQGPTVAPCDRASGPLGGGIVAWLTLSHTASPNTILVNQSTTLQADFFTNNLNTGIPAADLVALNGRAVVFNNAVLGTISGADPTINAGKANATFTAGATGGDGSADATVDSATVTALITINQPAGVETNPTDQTVCDGDTATFTASSSGFPTPTVQWQVSTGGPFTDIPGATSTTLMFTATTADNGNQYRAVFTNTSGTATSTAATLTVVVTMTSDPSDQSVCQGSTATFSTTASGIGPFSFVWKKGATILNNGDLGGRVTITSGSNTSTLMISNVQASDAGTYTVETTGTCGTATQSASLTLDSTPPSITCPANVTVEATCPSGAIATYTAPVGTDNCPGVTTTRTAGQASGSVFPIGTSTVTYTATDSSGNSTSCSFTVTVLTPQAVIQNLIASVSASSLSGTQKNGLLAKLNAALTAINNGQTNVACNKLTEFINSVGILVSHGDITAAQGQAWIDSANHVRNAIGCTNLGCS
jgi:CSLREA domain-containing protein